MAEGEETPRVTARRKCQWIIEKRMSPSGINNPEFVLLDNLTPQRRKIESGIRFLSWWRNYSSFYSAFGSRVLHVIVAWRCDEMPTPKGAATTHRWATSSEQEDVLHGHRAGRCCEGADSGCPVCALKCFLLHPLITLTSFTWLLASSPSFIRFIDLQRQT